MKHRDINTFMLAQNTVQSQHQKDVITANYFICNSTVNLEKIFRKYKRVT